MYIIYGKYLYPGFLNWGIPKTMVFNIKIALLWVIWGTPISGNLHIYIYIYILWKINIDPENHQFSVVSLVFQPFSGRVYVNLLKGK